MAGGGIIATGGGRQEQYTGRTTGYVIWTCIIAATGGLLFGYDNGVTGGVISFEEFERKFFPQTLEKHKESQYCKWDDHYLQLFTSSLFLAGLIAALCGTKITAKYGRKPSMITAGLAFMIGVVLTTAATHLAMLIIGRMFLGVGVGLSTQAVPLYLAEVAPFKLRGALNILFQLAITIGILIAQLINYGTHFIQPWGWRLSLGLAAVPALLFTLGALFVPESPNSLVEQGKMDEARAVLERIRGVSDVQIEFEDIIQAAKLAEVERENAFAIVKKRWRPQLVTAILVPAFQQLTGINTIIFYAPQLFQSLGSSDIMSLVQTVVIGSVNVCATFVAIACVDKFGRKVLFWEGGVQMFIAEVALGIILGTQFADGHVSKGLAVGLLILICIFIAGFAWSWGPLGWLVPIEIQPLETRSAGNAINTAINFLLTFIIGQFFLSMLCAMKFGTFFFFAGWLFLMTTYVTLFLPETKNVPIEEVVYVSFRHHWFWGRVMKDTYAEEPEPGKALEAELGHVGDRGSANGTNVEARADTHH